MPCGASKVLPSGRKISGELWPLLGADVCSNSKTSKTSKLLKLGNTFDYGTHVEEIDRKGENMSVKNLNDVDPNTFVIIEAQLILNRGAKERFSQPESNKYLVLTQTVGHSSLQF